MEAKIQRDVRFLKGYAILVTLAFVWLFVSGSSSRTENQRFEEIDVERINIVETDGQLRMVISNKARQHPGIVNGKIIQRDHPRPPGMLFFNHLGDEMGGLVFDENGGNGHFGSLTFDKVRNDQTIGFRYLESDNGAYFTGLEVWQQPNMPSDVLQAKYDSARTIEDEALREAAFQAMRENGELMTKRVFLGKWRNDASVLELLDMKGHARIRMAVAADGRPTLEFLSESGDVEHSIP